MHDANAFQSQVSRAYSHINRTLKLPERDYRTFTQVQTKYVRKQNLINLSGGVNQEVCILVTITRGSSWLNQMVTVTIYSSILSMTIDHMVC